MVVLLVDGCFDVFGLVDCFGWVVEDLCILVMEKCLLCCMYCMLAEGLLSIVCEYLLTFGEIGRLVGIVVCDFGVCDVWFMGGELFMCVDFVAIIVES